MVALPGSVLRRYRRFSLYNSPYPAHDEGRAVDLYPAAGAAPSPVAGEVLDVRTVRAPPKPYAAEHDHLILVDAGEYVARVLHVDPAVEPGEQVAVGDPLGSTVRSGFFAPWVDDHVHLEFRERGRDPYRASGSTRIEADVAVEPLAWDGTGTVAEAGGTYVVLDDPVHPAPGERFVGVAAEWADAAGRATLGEGVVLDGGLVHYASGGALGDAGENANGRSSAAAETPAAGPRSVSLLGERVGVASGRTVSWADVDVLADGRPITGLSLFAARDADFGAKLICPDHDFAVGDRVAVEIRPTGDPVRLSAG
jgi:hypothetical protein